jgi:hypothetical protein
VGIAEREVGAIDEGVKLLEPGEFASSNKPTNKTKAPINAAATTGRRRDAFFICRDYTFHPTV